MELTKEYFDKTLDQKLDQKLDEKLKSVATKHDLEQFATKKDLERFATKKDLEKFPTKQDLEAQTKKLQKYTDEVADTILEAVDYGFSRVHRRLDKIENVQPRPW
jgi:hypothetical protein